MTERIGGGSGGAFEDTDGDGVAELQEQHATLGGGDLRAAGSINGITWASNNDPDLPDFKTAVEAAGDHDHVALAPGLHDVDQETTATSRVSIHFFGRLNKTADVRALRIQYPNVHLFVHANPVVESSVADTTPGIEYNARTYIPMLAEVDGVGGPGHYLHQDGSHGADNLNNMEALVSGFNCGGDGVRVENSTADPPDLNGMLLEIPYVGTNTGDGLHLLGGFGNKYEVGVTQGNSNGVHIEGADDNEVYIGDSEGNATGLVTDAASNGNDLEVRNIADGYSISGGNRFQTVGANGEVQERGNGALQLLEDQTIQFYDENGDSVSLYVDAGELIVRDSAGNTTTLS